MYNLPYFKDKDNAEVFSFIHKNPFAFLTGVDAELKPVATQVPVFIEERDGTAFLSGHIMKNTDHHKAFTQNDAVLCVFTGPNSYVSATWYNDPHQASTWNYMSVHAKGKIRFGDEESLIEILKKTTAHFENYNNSSPTVYENLPADYREKLLKGIVAFEIEVLSMDHVFKLSQNRDEQSFSNIISHLDNAGAGGKEIAEQMRKRKGGLYP